MVTYPYCNKMRILIVDDHLIFGQSLAALLTVSENVDVVATVGSGRAALQKLASNEVDVVISDLQMPEIGGVELALQIREHHPQVKIMILSMIDEAHLIREALRAGVLGFGSKTIDKWELSKALAMIEKGEVYLSSSVIQELSRTPATHHTEVISNTLVLSEREIEVLKLVAQEMNTNEIAEKLFVSVNTIETHRKNLLKKLGVKNSIGLIKFAIRHGLVD